MAFLEWLEFSALADWVATSAWGYPLMLTSHSVGLAIIVGILFVINMRILGYFSSISVASLRCFLKLAWAGFVVNLISGLALFVAQATFFATHIAFLIKIAAIFFALINAVFIQNMLRRQGEAWDKGEPITGHAKTLAICSLTLWLVAIIAGRLIAYI